MFTEIHVLHDLTQPVLSANTQMGLDMLHKGYPHVALNNIRYQTKVFHNTVEVSSNPKDTRPET